MLCLVLLLLAALGVGAVWGNRSLQVQEVAVDCPGLPAAFQGFRLAQVSDLHNAAFGRDNARLLAALAQAEPESILLTGDLADSRRTNLAVALSFARQAAAIAPVYYVPGNHEARLAQYAAFAAALEAAGGQVRLPGIGGLFAPGQGLFPRYDGGLYRRGQARMVVSRGLGNSLFPLRVGNRPEVVVATLHPAPSVEGQ